MTAEKVRALLDRNQVRYVSIRHSPAYTAHEIAQSAHVSGKEMAKTVIVKIESWMAMVVLPASRRLSLETLQSVVGTRNVRLAKEHEFANLFPDCEPGAMPPFGNLYGLDVYVDPALALDDEIVFNAGTHTELIRMRYVDFENLVQPKIVAVA
jgi:Ala-tRNA(Pro) deacylase